MIAELGMQRFLLAAATAAVLLSPNLSEARISGPSAGYHRDSSYCASCARGNQGRIARSGAVKEGFMAETGYAHGRPGYVVDHVIALKRGGADSSFNMQWQTKAEAKATDKWE
jgi:hypothetical protein